MPLSSDAQINQLGEDLIAQFQGIFGKYPGYRPTHAKGLLVSGSFTPTSTAASLSKAPHFKSSSTPVTVRFSDTTGIPTIPDTSPDSSPRGFGLRFHLGDRVHTDIIAHSTPLFPVNNGQDFLSLLKGIASSPAGIPSPSPIEKFLGEHPAAFKFATAEKPTPISFANEAFYSVNAFKLINAEGKETLVRYRIIPDAGQSYLDKTAVENKSGDFLFEDLPKHIQEKGKISFTVKAQIAEEGDVTDDATVTWPEERKLVDLGKVELDKLVPDNDKEQKRIILDPIPRVEGIEPSADPILEVRAALYLISGRQRRAA